MECLDCGNNDPKQFEVKRDTEQGVVISVQCKAQLGANVCNSTFVLVEDEDNNLQLAAANEIPAEEPKCKQCLDTGFVQDAVTHQPRICPACKAGLNTSTDIPVAPAEQYETVVEESELVSGNDLDEDDGEDEEER